MAFPQVAGTNTTGGSTASASAVVNLPASIAAGDLLLVLHRSAIGTASHAVSGGGWTNLFNDASDTSDDRTSLWYRLADGTEGATITITQTSSKFASLAWRITGAENPGTQAPEFATLAIGQDALPDPGSLTPTGGAKDYLWLWMGGWQGEQTSPPASNPTNYGSNIIGASSGTAGLVTTNCRVASASRELNATSEDPSGWTISVIDAWTATVVAVHPGPPPPETTTSKTAFAVPTPPPPRTQGALGWLYGLLTTTLAPPPGTPFTGSAQNLPPRPAVAHQTWVQAMRMAAAGIASTPRAASFSLPRQPAWRPPEFVFQTLLLTTLAVVTTAAPIAAQDWPNPRTSIPAISLRTWTDGHRLPLLGQDMQFGAAGQPKIYDYPNPQRPRPPTVSWDYGLLDSTLSVAAPVPFAQTDWPLPRAAVPAISLRTWIDTIRLNLLRQDTFFAGAGRGPTYDYPNPRVPVPPISLRTWLDSRLLDTLAFVQPRPFAQLDWPVPRPAIPAVVLRTWIDTVRLNLLGRDTFFGAPGQPPTYAWPLPSSIRRSADLFAFLNLLESTLGGAAPAPFAQYQWPNPIVRVAPVELRAYLNLLESTLGIAPRPFSMLDWPNPKNAIQPVQLRTWIDVLKLNLLGKDTVYGAPGQVPTYQPAPPPRNRIVPPQFFVQPPGPAFFPVFVPAGFILVSGETAIIPTASGEGFIVVTATGEIFLIPTAGGESSVTGSGG